MKILVSAIDSGGFGGAEVFEHLLAKYLNTGNNTAYIWANINSPMHEYLENNKFQNTLLFPVRMDMVGNIRGFIKYFMLFPFAYTWGLIGLFKFKLKGGSHIILTGFSDKILLSHISKILGLKVVWIEQGPYGDLLKHNFGIPSLIFKRNIRYSDLIIVFTQNTLSKISNIFSELIPKAKIIPCGIELINNKQITSYKKDAQVIKYVNKWKEKKIIGLISRIEQKDAKGQEKLIELAQLLKRKRNDFLVVIAGPGNDARLKFLIKQKKLENHVKLMGYVNDKYALLSIFDIFIFPSTWDMEGFGLVPLEAMMMGVPVIASSHPPIPEVVGSAADIVEAKPILIQKRVELLLDNDKKRLEYINKGYERIKLFNIENIAKIYIDELSGL